MRLTALIEGDEAVMVVEDGVTGEQIAEVALKDLTDEELDVITKELEEAEEAD